MARAKFAKLGWSRPFERARSYGIYGAARLIPSAATILVQGFFAHQLSGAAFGTLILSTSAVFVLYGTLMHWLAASVERLLPQSYPGRTYFISSLLALSVAVYVTFGVGLWTIGWLAPTILRVTLQLDDTLSAVIIFVGAEFVHNLALEVARRTQKHGIYLTLAIVRTGTMSIVAVAAALILYEPAYILFGMAIGSILSLLVVCPIRRRDVSIFAINKNTIRFILAYGVPISFAAFFRALSERADRFLLAATFGIEIAGVYAAVVDLTRRALEVPTIAVYLHSFPRIIIAWNDDMRPQVDNLVRRNLWDIVSLLLPAAFGFWIAGQFIIVHLYGPSFVELSKAIIPIIAAGTVFECVRQYHYDLVFLLERRTVYATAIAAVGAATSLVVLFVGIHIGGVPGAAFGMLASRVLMLSASATLGSRMIGMSFSCLELVGLAIIVMIAIGVHGLMDAGTSWRALAEGATLSGTCFAGIAALRQVFAVRHRTASALPHTAVNSDQQI